VAERGRRRIRIAILAGGRSSEREISLSSARSVLDTLDPERYEVVPVLIERDGGWRVLGDAAALEAAAGEPAALPEATAGTALVPGQGPRALVDGAGGAGAGPIDVVFPVLHGPFGEDGTVQGLLETVGLPYVGAGVAGSAVAMDKDLGKAVLRNAGIPVTSSLTLRDGTVDAADPALADLVERELGWPVFVKPASLGSSVGITKVRTRDELQGAVELALSHDPKALVEEFVAGRELECGVLGNEELQVSAVGEIRPHADWYDYGAKYDEGGSDILIPADLPDDVALRVQDMAVAAFRAMEAAGMARVDFFLRPDGGLLVNEVNTIPGFAPTSVYARLFAARGLDYGALVDRLVELGLERHERRARYRY
jgi:D-alanine-D-alanine ligase